MSFYFSQGSTGEISETMSPKKSSFFSYGNLGQGNLIFTSQRFQKLYKHNNHNLGDQFHCCYLRPADPDILSQEDGGGGKRQTESRKEKGIRVDISFRKDHRSCGLRIVSVEE